MQRHAYAPAGGASPASATARPQLLARPVTGRAFGPPDRRQANPK